MFKYFYMTKHLCSLFIVDGSSEREKKKKKTVPKVSCYSVKGIVRFFLTWALFLSWGALIY